MTNIYVCLVSRKTIHTPKAEEVSYCAQPLPQSCQPNRMFDVVSGLGLVRVEL